MLAVVDYEDVVDGAINWSNVELLTADSASACAGGETAQNYVLPVAYDENAIGSTVLAEAGSSVKYLVLVAADGTPYPQETIRIFADDDKTDSSLSGTINVPQNDQFFVDFGGSDLEYRPSVPVAASNVESLALAISNAEYDADQEAYVYSLAAGAEISVDTAETADITALTEALTALGTKIMEGASAGNTAALVVDLNGGTFELSSKVTFADSYFTGLTAFTVQNGTLKFNGKQEDAAELASKYAISFYSTTGTALFDNVDIVTNKSGVYVGNGVTGTITFKDSSVTSYGKYGITVLGGDVVLNNTEVNVLKAEGAENVILSTALFVAGGEVKVSNNSTLSAAGQAVVVREGTVSISDSTLGLVEGYTDTVYTTSTAFEEAFGTVDFSITAGTNNSAITGFTPGYDTQDYRSYGIWGTENAVTRATLVIGNSSTTEYTEGATVTLSNVTLNTIDTIPTMVIAAHYAAENTDAKVTVTWEGNDAALEAALAYNTVTSSVVLNPEA